MRAWLSCLLVASACTGAERTVRDDSLEPSAASPAAIAKTRLREIVERVGREVDCNEATRQFLCVVADVALDGERPVLPWPTSPHLMAGLSWAVRPSRTIVGGANETLRYAVGELGPSGIWTAEPGGSDDASRNLLYESQLQLARVFGSLDVLPDPPVPVPIAEALTRPAPIPSTTTQRGASWEVDGGRVFASPATTAHPGAWIVVEPVGLGARLRVLLDDQAPALDP